MNVMKPLFDKTIQLFLRCYLTGWDLNESLD